jgi:hypothetical protein
MLFWLLSSGALEGSAVHAPELVIEPRLQIVRRHRRSLPLRLEQALEQPSKIMSIACRNWAAVGQPI